MYRDVIVKHVHSKMFVTNYAEFLLSLYTLILHKIEHCERRKRCMSYFENVRVSKTTAIHLNSISLLFNDGIKIIKWFLDY